MRARNNVETLVGSQCLFFVFPNLHPCFYDFMETLKNVFCLSINVNNNFRKWATYFCGFIRFILCCKVYFFNVATCNIEFFVKLQGNTFQTVLITNGRHSYVIFNYNKIEWITGSASEGVLAQVSQILFLLF